MFAAFYPVLFVLANGHLIVVQKTQHGLARVTGFMAAFLAVVLCAAADRTGVCGLYAAVGWCVLSALWYWLLMFRVDWERVRMHHLLCIVYDCYLECGVVALMFAWVAGRTFVFQ